MSFPLMILAATLNKTESMNTLLVGICSVPYSLDFVCEFTQQEPHASSQCKYDG